MTKSIDPRLADESKPEEIRRRARELAEDLPQLAKIALEAMIRDHNPDYKGTANKAGRAGSFLGQKRLKMAPKMGPKTHQNRRRK